MEDWSDKMFKKILGHVTFEEFVNKNKFKSKMKIEKYRGFPTNQYIQEAIQKKIVILHHTASGEGVDGDINWWKKDPARVGAPYIISREGVVTEVFDPKYWIYSLGIPSSVPRKFGSSVTPKRLEQLNVSIEIDSWGGLTRKGDKFYSYTGKEVPAKNVIDYGKSIRGSQYYEIYTDEQIASLKNLLLHIHKEYGVPLYYHPNMFEQNSEALKGYHGIWSHVSYRSDKQDCHPQPNLINMLKSIKQN